MRCKIGAIFGDFHFYGGNHKSVTNPWQPKAADTIWCGVAPGGWPDLHGFGDMVRGIRGRSDEHDEHEEHEGKIVRDCYKHSHTRLSVTPAGPNHPPKSNQTTRKDTKVEFLRRDQIASQMVEWKD